MCVTYLLKKSNTSAFMTGVASLKVCRYCCSNSARRFAMVSDNHKKTSLRGLYAGIHQGRGPEALGNE